MSQYKRTIEIRGISFDVSFDFQEEEKEVLNYGDGSGYPGCAASIDYIHIEFKDVDFTDFFEEEMEKVEELIWKSFEE